MRFNVKAMGDTGQVVSLSLEAANPVDATRQVMMQGLSVITLEQESTWSEFRLRTGLQFDLLLFSQELLALLDAGLSLVEAMETLVEKEARADAKRVLETIIDGLYEGQSFSQALANLPDVFPELLVATLKASERTGDLPQALQRFISHERRVQEQRNKLVGALFYPAMVIAVAVLVTIALLWFLVPKFSAVYDDSRRSLPFLSQMVINWGKLVKAYPLQVTLGSIGSAVALLFLATRPAIKDWVSRWLWRIEFIGSRLRVFQLSRFYRSVGMLLRGGIPAVQALAMVSDVLHVHLRAPLARAIAEVREGKSLSASMQDNGLTTPVSLRMLRVGERSGRMGDMMERIALFYDEETDRWLDWIGKAISPVLLVLLGLFVGGIVVLLYLPIFEIAGSLG